MTSNSFRRTLIGFSIASAMGLSASNAMAANNDGSLAGQVSEGGATITIVNEKNGLTRTVVADEEGNFRFARLPIGLYDVKASKEGFNTSKADDVKVSIGQKSDVTLTLEEGDVEVISVTAGRYQMLDMASSETGINIDAVDLERVPVGRSVASVANLSTSVQTGSFGGVSFGGASVSHNAVFINGLNVTDVERGIGYNSVPFSFYEEFQVKTGGYSVEFGRTTGGVINAVTKSGGNNFEFGADLFYTPDSLEAEQKNIYWSDGDVRFNRSEDEQDSYTMSLYASGPIIEDTLFFYAMYEPRKVDSTDIGGQQNEDIDESVDDSGFWGTKIDWQINDQHLVELLAFSDEQETLTDIYRDGEFQSKDFFSTGGTNYSLTYTGYLTDNFTAKALVGQSEYEYSFGGSTDPFCNRVFDTRDDLNEHIGCTENGLFDERVSSRDALRLDFEWYLGDHLLRFGMDNEERETDYSRRVPGPDYQRYTLHDVTPGSIFDGVLIPEGVTQEATVYKRRNNTIARQDTKAAYVEDVWSFNDNMTLTAGLRWDSFEMYQGDGSTFFKVDDMISPRVGFSWDINGDGQSKFFAHAGRYYQPMPLAVSARAAGNSEFRISNYVLEGVESEEINGQTNIIPILGEELDYIDFSSSAGLGPGDVDQDVEATFQNEFIVGYEMMISEKWSAGVRAIHRDYRNAFEDMYVDVVPGDHPSLPAACGNIWGWFFGNPGRDLELQLDCGNGPQDVTIPLGEATDSWNSITGEVIGGDQPRRLYNAVELELDRAWDDKWTANIAYTWSNSYGNFSGGGLARTGNDIPGYTEIADDVSILNTNWGKLPNHLAHNFKVRGAYQIDENWRVGAVFTAESGKPINAVSSSNPYTGANANAQTHYQCVSNCSDLDNAEWIHIPNGFYGDLGWYTRLDVNVSYETEINGADVRLGLDVFNLLDSQSVTSVVTDIDDGTVGEVDSEFMMPNGTASPRYVRLSASVRF